MNFKILMVAIMALAVYACSHSNHEPVLNEEPEEIKFQYTAYTNNHELFAETDPFITGQSANIRAHFSVLPGFNPVESGEITVVLSAGGKEITQTLGNPTLKGIYSFDLKPEIQGKGTLKFIISGPSGQDELLIPEVTVFASHDEAETAAAKTVLSRTNTTVFTKEQSWKIDFSTGYPEKEPFGQVIKTTALVQSTQGGEIIVTAKTNGIVFLTGNNLFEGREISAGQNLFTISGSDLADNNITVRFAEAKNNYEKAKADYERARDLAKDRIVSDKDLLTAKNQYENTKAIYENLNKNFNSDGQYSRSPMSGFIKQVFVKNGAYVEAGQPVLTVSQNKTLILSADVPQKYASVLGSIYTANIRSVNGTRAYSFEELNGRVLSYGKAANTDNYLIPVTLQIDNRGSFTAGGFVEIFLKTMTNAEAVTVFNSALLEEQGSYFVWVQITPELFEKREVTTGKTDGIKTEILSGLTENERIVNRGAMPIKLAQASGTLDAHSGHVH